MRKRGGLTEKVRRKPYSLVLFDEIEKAHPDVLNLLLQILEDGKLTDSHGKIADFKNTIIIMTSNVGARLITEKKTLGFKTDSDDDDKKDEELKRQIMQELKRSFRPEFINRIDDIIIFNKLGKSEMIEIASLMLKEVENRMIEKGIKLTVTEEAKKLIVEKGIDENYGARPLRRTIQTMVENSLAEEILQGNIKVNDTVQIHVKEGNLKLSV